MINFFHRYFSLPNVSNHNPEAEWGVEGNMGTVNQPVTFQLEKLYYEILKFLSTKARATSQQYAAISNVLFIVVFNGFDRLCPTEYFCSLNGNA